MPEETVSVVEDLVRGVRYFRSHTFPKNRELYEGLAEKQRPHTLFLTCGDSRIDPSALTNTEPGQIFVERTPGNIVPIYSDAAAVGVSASIEYSVLVLGVSAIVVCGHSACGAMKALLDPEELHHAPATARWLGYAKPAVGILEAGYPQLEGAERLKRLCELNLRIQMMNLYTHPVVESRLSQGRLEVHCWYYEIHAGRVEAYNPKTGEFEDLI
jgi:carbonic anhydrase